MPWHDNTPYQTLCITFCKPRWDQITTASINNCIEFCFLFRFDAFSLVLSKQTMLPNTPKHDGCLIVPSADGAGVPRLCQRVDSGTSQRTVRSCS